MRCMIACPLKRSRLHYRAAESVFEINKWLNENGHFSNFLVAAIAVSVEARNIAMTRFIEDKSDVYIGIDETVGVDIEVFKKMFHADLDMVGTRVPKPHFDKDKVSHSIRRGLTEEEQKRLDEDAANGKGEQGLIRKTESTDSGFFIVKGKALQDLITKKLVSENIAIYPRGKEVTYTYYTPIDLDNGVRLSEEASFCKRLTDAGYDIHEYHGPGITTFGEVTYYSG